MASGDGRPFGELFATGRVTWARGNDSAAKAVAPFGPDTLEIQPTARCHRVCAFCSHIVRNRNGEELTAEQVALLLDDARQLGVARVAFSGGGEPLFWATGDLAAAMEQARSFAVVSLTSSGDQLWSREDSRLSALADRVLPHCDDLLLNVPGVTEASIRDQVTDGPGWADVEGLLHALVARRRSGWKGRLICVVVVNRGNLDELPLIDQTFAAIGVDDVYYKPLKLVEDRLPGAAIATTDLTRRFRSLSVPAEASPALARFLPSIEAQPASGACWMNLLGFNAIVDPRGDVYLCTPTVGEPQHRAGNLGETRFAELWNSQARRDHALALSERSARGDCPSHCRFHPHNQAIDAWLAGRPIAAELQSSVNAGISNDYALDSSRLGGGAR